MNNYFLNFEKLIGKGIKRYFTILAVPLIFTTCSNLSPSNAGSDNGIHKVGKGAYRKQPLSRDRKVPEALYRTDEMKKYPVPTNTWYSSIVFTEWSEVLHAHPLTFKATKDGLEMGLPEKQILPTQREDVEVFYPHISDITLSPSAFKPTHANLADFSDWSVTLAFENETDTFSSIITHGVPFTYLKFSSGDMLAKLNKGLKSGIYKNDSRVLLVSNAAKNYALFAPTGAQWIKESGGADNSDITKPTFGDNETLMIYDGRLASQMLWESYNPSEKITVTDSDNESVFFLDREDRKDKYLKIKKTGEDGNVYVSLDTSVPKRLADLSFWENQGEVVLDVRWKSGDSDAELLIKLDSGWPNVSDFQLPLKKNGEWQTFRIPIKDILLNGNTFNPGAFADISGIKHIFVMEPTGPMEVDVDNIRFEMNRNIEVVSETNSWKLILPAGKKFASAAVLPDNSDETLQKYIQSAYSFITDTKVKWTVDNENSRVRSDFTFVTEAMEGEKKPPIIGLYPHHYYKSDSIPNNEIGAFNTIRGAIRLFETDHFSVTNRYIGFVPYWPKVQNEERKDMLETQLSRDRSRSRGMLIEEGWGAYWQGKGFQRISQLMNVAHTQGEEGIRDRLLDLIQTRYSEWFSTLDPNWYFHYNPEFGTVVSYPEEYDAVRNMNDHHFHYGYWIRAAAEVALFDPEWAKDENYGGMINLLISDIATTQRKGRDFPFLRNFDVYEGHSWAGGLSNDPNGNNQESSSEAVNAWAGLILWGAVTGNRELVDLGKYLYSTEISAINHYWFDLYDQVLPEEYLNEEVSIVFGGKLSHIAWWTDEPRQIKGINYLPLTPSSTYLATDPAYITGSMEALKKEMEIYRKRGKYAKPEDIWQDIFAKYLALADPKAGFQQWDEYGAVELGDTRSHVLHWISILEELGTPDLEITADTTFYAVFKTDDGKRTYLAYNAGSTTKEVKFSNGFTLSAKQRELSMAKDN